MKKRCLVLLLVFVLSLSLLPTASAVTLTERTVYTEDQSEMQRVGEYWIVPCSSDPDVENMAYYFHTASAEFEKYGDTVQAGCDVQNLYGVNVLRIFFGSNITFVQQREVQVWFSGEFVSLKFLLLPEGCSAAESRAVEDGDLIKNSDYSAYRLQEVDGKLDFSPYGPVEFQYEGSTYYLGMMLAIEKWPYRYGSEPVTANGTLTPRSMKAGIWTYDQNAGYQLVQNPEEIFPKDFLGSVGMEIFAENADGEYPMQIWQESTLPAVELYFSDDCHNAWYTVVTAELDGEVLTAVTRFEWIVNYVFDAEIEITDVQDINDQLAQWEAQTELEPELSNRTTFRIQLPATVENELGQDIVIPEGLRSVRLEGKTDYGNGIFYTTIYACGVQADCREVTLTNLHLYGVTQEEAGSEAPSVTEGKRGFYGAAQSQYRNCWFSLFDVGVEFADACSNGLRFGGQHVIIENCNVGYLMDNETSTNGGNIQMDDFVFRGNEVAIFLKHVSGNNPLMPYDYRIVNSFFYDNKVDVKNQTGRWFFFPGNVISHTNSPAETGSTETVSHVPVLEGGNTSVYPVACEVAPMQFAYFYEESGVISNNLTYEIPADALGTQEYAVIEDDEAIVAYSFDTEQTEPELVPLSLMELSEASAETFDPRVKITREEEQITLTMSEMPEGKAARVFVPCSWSNVTVLEGETELEAEADGERVSFLASKGGTYRIVRDWNLKLQAHDTAAGTVTVGAPNGMTGLVLVVSYGEGGQYMSMTAGQPGEPLAYDVRARALKLMLVTGLEEAVPLTQALEVPLG